MIKLLMCFFLNFFLFISVQADMDSVNVLKKRLGHINDFYACFVQKINIANNDTKEVMQGELWIKKPNLFHCHILGVEESFLIFDGKTIWFYIPMIKQVTAYNVNSDITDNIFFKLLFNNDILEWNNYNIIKKGDWFYFNPIFYKNINLKKYRIKINDQSVINQFDIVESDEKYINYHLFNQSFESIDVSKFHFIISSDIELDDQR